MTSNEMSNEIRNTLEGSPRSKAGSLQSDLGAAAGHQRPLPVTTPTRTIARIMIPVIFLVGIQHMKTATSFPGEGFTAGVLWSLGLFLAYMGWPDGAPRVIPLSFISRIGPLGIVSILVSGVVGLMAGSVFLHHQVLHLPFIGELHSAALFDIGIFLAVFSVFATIILILRGDEN